MVKVKSTSIRDLEHAKFVKTIAGVRVDINVYPKLELTRDVNGRITQVDYKNDIDELVKRTILTRDGNGRITQVTNTFFDEP